MRKATSTSPTAPTTACRFSITTSASRQATTTSAIPGRSAFRRARTSISLLPTPIRTATLRGRGTSRARSTRWNWTGRSSAGSAMPSKQPGGFQVVHMMDCRNPNEIFVAEIESWRVQKLLLKPQAARRAACEMRLLLMRRFLQISPASMLLAVAAQAPAPEIPFDSVANLLKYPGQRHHRRSGRRGDEFQRRSFRLHAHRPSDDLARHVAALRARRLAAVSSSIKTGKFVREIGQDSYGFLVAQQVRVDPQDNIWIVDQMSSMVIKFDPNGRVQLLLGRKSESERVPPAPLPPADAAGRGARPARGGRGPAGAGAQSDIVSAAHRRGVGCRRQHLRGRWLRQLRAWPSSTRTASSSSPGVRRGRRTGQFNSVRGIALDAQGNVYVADAGNKRIQVFDGDGNFQDADRRMWERPSAICITPGSHQYLYSSNSNPPDDIDTDGEIYKLELDGTDRRASSARRASCRRSSARSMPSIAAATTSFTSERSATGECRSSLCDSN